VVSCADVPVVGNSTGVVCSAAMNIGRVHKSLFGSLYPVKMTFFFYMT
jgi:hypothetical protein